MAHNACHLRDVRTDGIWKYTVSNDDSASIVGVTFNLKGKVMIPDIVGGHRVTSIGRNALALLYDVTDVVVSEGVRNLGAGCFKYSGLRSLTLP